MCKSKIRTSSIKYKDTEDRRELARVIALEGITLLRNENKVLPMDTSKSIAVFGRGQIETQTGGMGSGASHGASICSIIEGLIKKGFNVDIELLNEYKRLISLEPKQEVPDFMKLITSGIIYEIWGAYNKPSEEILLEEAVIEKAALKSDTAIIVITRNSGGEECDRRVENDYYLLSSEQELVKQVTDKFSHVVVLLNTNGFVDVSWANNYKNIEGILFIGLAGEAAGTAVADILSGACTPSGKLSSTMALSYDDYPTAEHFSYNKDSAENILTYESYGLDAAANASEKFDLSPVTVYKEGIYVGYRYFDTFNKKVMYPFGFGLSYTEFDFKSIAINMDNLCNIEVVVDVKNKGAKYSGKEVVQVYISQPDGKIEKPYQKLVGYTKSNLLLPNESEQLSIKIPVSELASYDENSASYLIEAGEYAIRIGNSSRNTCMSGIIKVEEDIIVEKLSNKLELNPANRGKIDFLKNNMGNRAANSEQTEQYTDVMTKISITKDCVKTKSAEYNSYFNKLDLRSTEHGLNDVKTELITIEEFVSQLTKEELAVMVNGHGKGVPFGGIGLNVPDTIQYENGIDIGVNTHSTGNNNYVSPGIKRVGISSILYKDGPAGVQKTAWPVEMVMADTWNSELLYEFGDAVGYEAEESQVDVWLAPAVNLHRNPICGRNYEYYSEDPLLTGSCAVAVTNGVQQNHRVIVCPKHFALNEQETYRRGNSKKNIDAADSIVQERVARELYLKPFQMLVKSAGIRNIMTSFNKINGVFAAGNYDLCTAILRDEWGFEGFVVTDWGDMDTVVNGADAVAAGNDIVMPGGPIVIKQVLDGVNQGRCTIAQLQRNTINLLRFVLDSQAYENYYGSECKPVYDEIAAFAEAESNNYHE